MIEELGISSRLTKTEHTNKHAEKSCTEDTLVFFFPIILASPRSYLKESEVAQSCPAICDPMDCRLLHPWDFPARVLEWVAIPFFRGSSQPRDRTQSSHITGRRFYCLSHQGSLSYLTRYQTRVPCSKSAKSQPLDHQGSLKILFIYLVAPCGMWNPSSLTRD